jgi:hypothetical protein
MTFKNENELKAFFMQKCKNAIMQTQNKVYAIIKKALVEFYGDYDPVLYERTYQLLHSLVKSEIRQVRNGYRADVYFDLSSIDYMTGNMPTGHQVMKAAEHGMHGAVGKDLQYVAGNSGVDIWNSPMQKIDAQVIDMIVRELKAQGIPVI